MSPMVLTLSVSLYPGRRKVRKSISSAPEDASQRDAAGRTPGNVAPGNVKEPEPARERKRDEGCLTGDCNF